MLKTNRTDSLTNKVQFYYGDKILVYFTLNVTIFTGFSSN